MLQRITRRLGKRPNAETTRDLEVVQSIGRDGIAGRHASNEEVRELVRCALEEALAGGVDRGAPENRVRQILRLACDAARQRATTVEHVIVVLKDALYEVSETSSRPHSETMAILGRVVTLCIEEYYVPRETS